MSWSSNQEIHEACVAKIKELTHIPNTLQRYHAALNWIIYCSARPELAGDNPIQYFAVLADSIQNPELVNQE